MTGKQRIAGLPRAEWSEASREVFGYWEGPDAKVNGSRSNVMMVMANHPELAMRALDMGRYVLTESTLSERQRELIVLRIAWRFDCEHQWVHHCISARRIGFTEDELAAMASDSFQAIADPLERAIVQASDELSRGGKIGDATWDALAERLDTHGLMDVIYSIGFFAMNAWAMGAMQLKSETDLSQSKSATQLLSDQ